MFGRHRLNLITILLAAAIFMLFAAGDGFTLPGTFESDKAPGVEGQDTGFTCVRTERILLEGTAFETVLYIIDSQREGPTVMVIGGVHGDEPAGYLAAESMVSWAPDRGTLLIIPRAVVPAVEIGERNAPGEGDLNRSFPGNREGDPVAALAAAVFEIMLEFEPCWLIDLHEALHFERDMPGALGQTLIYPHEANSLDIVNDLVTAVNRTIFNDQYHFTLLRGKADGSTMEAALMVGADTMSVETCRQMNLKERVRYQRQVVTSLLYLLGVTVY